MPLTRHHATAFLGLPASHALEELRRTWDPEMARQIAAHITLIYPEEIPDPAQLTAQAARAAARTAPFTIALGPAFHAGSPADGVFLHISDPDGGIARFRATAVPASQATGFPPHVTIAHPRTSRHGTQAWAELASVHLDARITITQVAITAYDGDRWPTLQTIALTGRQPPD
jgi:2'-5' RNA ligase